VIPTAQPQNPVVVVVGKDKNSDDEDVFRNYLVSKRGYA
jgi:hypothetical protein